MYTDVLCRWLKKRERVRVKHQKLENIGVALRFMESEGMKLVNIGKQRSLPTQRMGWCVKPCSAAGHDCMMWTIHACMASQYPSCLFFLERLQSSDFHRETVL